jgi:hypothetical protein
MFSSRAFACAAIHNGNKLQNSSNKLWQNFDEYSTLAEKINHRALDTTHTPFAHHFSNMHCKRRRLFHLLPFCRLPVTFPVIFWKTVSAIRIPLPKPMATRSRFSQFSLLVNVFHEY